MNIKNFNDFDKPFYAVIAEDSSHSLSPQLHTLFNGFMNSKTPYFAFDIARDNFKEELNLILNYAKGINVTIPYKSMVIDFLDEITEQAKQVNAVNTIAKHNSILKGYNTDIQGFWDTLELNKVSLNVKKVLILGSGGVSSALAYACFLKGARVEIASRDKTKFRGFKEEESIKVINYNEIDYKADIIINGTPVGMDRISEKSIIDLSLFSNLEFVFDSVYRPYITLLIREAAKRNIKYDNGLYMLVAQGYHSRLIWGDNAISIEDLDEVYKSLTIDLLCSEIKKQQISFISIAGFMGTGKTFIGIALAKVLGYTFIDLDAVIENEYGNISKIFDEQGENRFRQIEYSCVKKINKGNVILSLGGGAIINNDFAEYVKALGFVINLNRPIQDILKNIGDDNKRPLAKNKNTLQELYNERKDKYIENSHLTISPSYDVKDNIIKILTAILLK